MLGNEIFNIVQFFQLRQNTPNHNDFIQIWNRIWNDRVDYKQNKLNCEREHKVNTPPYNGNNADQNYMQQNGHLICLMEKKDGANHHTYGTSLQKFSIDSPYMRFHTAIFVFWPARAIPRQWAPFASRLLNGLSAPRAHILGDQRILFQNCHVTPLIPLEYE